jgi:glycosyltransferase involved in cell wall biosynthesis
LSTWHIITGEYPPQIGGVGDNARLVACGLAAAGEEVKVWTPHCSHAFPGDPGVAIRSLPDHFGPRSFVALDRALASSSRDRTLIQYVPHAFGLKAMNLPFCLWLYSRRRHRLRVNFHEVMFPIARGQRLSHNLLGTLTRLMALLVALAADHIFVSAPIWKKILRTRLGVKNPITLLPVPSNVPVVDDSESIHSFRRCYAGNKFLLAHFSTYAPDVANALRAFLPLILADNSEVAILLLGSGSAGFRNSFLRDHPEVSGRLHAAGLLSPQKLSCALSACDLLFQPYSDGVSMRRTTMMAALAHGLPVLTTCGITTERFWESSRAVALVPVGDIDATRALTSRILSDESLRIRLSSNARELYARRFDLRHTIAILRAN